MSRGVHTEQAAEMTAQLLEKTKELADAERQCIAMAHQVKRMDDELSALRNRIRMAHRALKEAIKTGSYMESVNEAEKILDLKRPLHDRTRR